PALAAVRDLRAAVPAPLAAARVVLLPTEVGRYAVEAATLARSAGLDLVTTAHAGNGVVHLVMDAGPAGDANGTRAPATVKVLAGLRDQARAAGGELVLEWAPLAVKEEVGPWDPPGPAVRLMERIKAQLDPKGIMNPGRFVGGL
ncbi:MAG: FAD-binding oxidoreductase, partial [Candidatus Rokuibacteriota bacterium]